MNNVFHEMYSGVRAPMSPHKLLYAVWQHSKHLAGYSQQDAHEFLIALLDGMCVHLGGKMGRNCDCIIHRIFTGALQSDVTCAKCKTVSTTIDPFWDVSLDIRAIAHMPTPNKMEAGSGAKGVREPLVHPDFQATTLEDCLKRYTRTEQLFAQIMCSKCGDRQGATKQMSMSQLPAVVCFHLKRFEHDARAAKISNVVTFPETLDMRPFLAHNISSEGAGAGAGPVKGGSAESDGDDANSADDTYSYTLFSVVNHYGTLQNGHYTNFVRSADDDGQWFLCNDETITMASIRDVLASEGYMLFYAKKRLEYVTPP
jgi:ubiquitin carboxyl-terminal hydrolase 22/27/51